MGAGKDSSWYALSCASNNSSLYSSYQDSWKLLQTDRLESQRAINSIPGDDYALTEAELTLMHLSRMEKHALNNLHGFCFTESEGESVVSEDDLTEEERTSRLIHLSRVEKNALNNIHGFCFTESEAESIVSEEDCREEDIHFDCSQEDIHFDPETMIHSNPSYYD